ncbi:DnaJ C-terminal domain-containing protein [Arsenicicoccus sp. oral taxon 190]|uniref:DnaJ C-terminal domain-containing protein n=1 Tax=Arsenicicoccus sp. oral taxon 190 TaxID=1658671 RepID=UPI000679F5AA|nr:J domain-containing protein [Arsenicicoccus sp. oral taxon 190]AKT50386.1 molecular chaperone DnaJ [Arsenicicoccus sp. oral taxon 190]
MASQDWFEKDFYATLGVPADADADAIKREYRKLARKHHPDQNPGDAAAEQKFKEVGEAYSVLSDPEQRQQYDAIRQMARGGARFAPGAGAGAGGGFEDVFSHLFTQGGAGGPGMRFTTSGGGAGQPDLDDLLRMFGGAGGGGQSPFGQGYGAYGAPTGPRPGADVQATVTIGFTEAVRGDTVTLTAVDGERVTTRIPAGVKDGQRIRLRGKGEHGDPQAPRGDLILTVQVSPHEVFGRDGDNLTVEVPVTFAEAALGATISVPTLGAADSGSDGHGRGHLVKVKIAPGTQSGQKLRVKGRGVAAKHGTGDLIVTVHVLVPTTLSDEARAAVEVLHAEDAAGDVRADLRARAARG